MLNPQDIKPGQEQYEIYKSSFPKRINGHRTFPKHCAYDYRHTDGELFSCVAPTLENARKRRDSWLKDK